MKNIEININQFGVQEIHNLIVNFKESTNIYTYRKSLGVSYKQFRRALMLHIAKMNSEN